MKQMIQLPNYFSSQEDAVITYNASKMTLAAHSDARYLSEPNACSPAGSHFLLSHYAYILTNNGANVNSAHIIKHVMLSATEAKLGALYIMAQEAIYICTILDKMGHKQTPSPLQTDNSMANGVVNGEIQPRQTQAMNMRFNWLKDCECQQFWFYKRPGKLTHADYWTKHHPTKHHKNIRNEFLTPFIMLEMLQQDQQLSMQQPQ